MKNVLCSFFKDARKTEYVGHEVNFVIHIISYLSVFDLSVQRVPHLTAFLFSVKINVLCVLYYQGQSKTLR